MGRLSIAKKVAAAALAYKAWKTVFPTKVKTVTGKRVLVTGAASGIGRLLAFELVRRGASAVVCWDIDEEGLEETNRQILAEFPNATVKNFTCNLADRADVYATADKMKGELDIIVNNAGIVAPGFLWEMSDEKIDLTFKVNVMSHFWVMKAFLPQMMKRNSGHIVTVASIAAYMSASGMVAYVSSKFAARGLLDALAMELHEQGFGGVKVSCVCPSHIADTPLFKGFNSMGLHTTAIDVVNAIIDCIEFETEVAFSPGYLKGVGMLGNTLLNMNGKLGFKLPLASPMHTLDKAQANRILSKLESKL